MAKHFFTIDNTSGAAGFVAWSRMWQWNLIPDVYAFHVHSVEHMVNKVLANLGGDVIGTLYIIGHAHSGSQSVGGGKSLPLGESRIALDPNADNPQLIAPASDTLARLCNQFADDAVVTLGGCKVGDDPDGPALLQVTSQVLGVPVQGGRFYQTALNQPFMLGGVTRCNGQSCVTVPWYQPDFLS